MLVEPQLEAAKPLIAGMSETGSIATGSGLLGDVRFTPGSDRTADIPDQQLRASFRPVRRNEEPLFDHPVRSRDKDGWKIEANCFRGFQVDDQFKSARPLDRQVARTRTPPNFVDRSGRILHKLSI